MSWLERRIEESEKRIAKRKEYEAWLETKPEVKQQVERLEEAALLCLKKTGVAAVAVAAGVLVNPASLIILVEAGRQYKKGLENLNKRNQIISENSSLQ